MKQVSFNRRQFLQLSFGLGVAWAIGAPVRRDTPTALEQGDLTALLRHQSSAKIIGQHYLQHYPHEANADQLLGLITAGVITDANASGQQLRDRLAQKIRQDFADERVVKLQGWLLARTEARLCALTTLI